MFVQPRESWAAHINFLHPAAPTVGRSLSFLPFTMARTVLVCPSPLLVGRWWSFYALPSGPGVCAVVVTSGFTVVAIDHTHRSSAPPHPHHATTGAPPPRVSIASALHSLPACVVAHAHLTTPPLLIAQGLSGPGKDAGGSSRLSAAWLRRASDARPCDPSCVAPLTGRPSTSRRDSRPVRGAALPPGCASSCPSWTWPPSTPGSAAQRRT